MIEGFTLPEDYTKVEVPYCYAVSVQKGAVFLEKNPFYSNCDERKVRYVLVECKGSVKVYKNGVFMREVPCERKPR